MARITPAGVVWYRLCFVFRGLNARYRTSRELTSRNYRLSPSEMQFSASVRFCSLQPPVEVRLNVTIPKVFLFVFCYMRHCQIWIVNILLGALLRLTRFSLRATRVLNHRAFLRHSTCVTNPHLRVFSGYFINGRPESRAITTSASVSFYSVITLLVFIELASKCHFLRTLNLCVLCVRRQDRAL